MCWWKLYSVVLRGTLNAVWQTTFDLNQIRKINQAAKLLAPQDLKKPTEKLTHWDSCEWHMYMASKFKAMHARIAIGEETKFKYNNKKKSSCTWESFKIVKEIPVLVRCRIQIFGCLLVYGEKMVLNYYPNEYPCYPKIATRYSKNSLPVSSQGRSTESDSLAMVVPGLGKKERKKGLKRK